MLISGIAIVVALCAFGTVNADPSSKSPRLLSTVALL